MKLNLKNKKTNIIFTSIFLALAIAITVITGVQFKQFSNFEAEFYTQDVDQVLYFSQYSPSLKGSVGDAEIYVKYGNRNAVAVAKAENASNFANLTATTKIAGVQGSEQLTAAQTSLIDYTIEEKTSAAEVIACN